MSKSDVPTPIDAALHSLEDFVDSDFFEQKKEELKRTDFFLRRNAIFLNSFLLAKLARYLYCTYSLINKVIKFKLKLKLLS